MNVTVQSSCEDFGRSSGRSRSYGCEQSLQQGLNEADWKRKGWTREK